MDLVKLIKIVLVWAAIIFIIKMLFFTDYSDYSLHYNNFINSIIYYRDVYSVAKLGILVMAIVAVFNIYMKHRKG